MGVQVQALRDTHARSAPYETRFLTCPRISTALPREEGDSCRHLLFQRKLLNVADPPVDQHIRLEETDDGSWPLYFNTALFATLDKHS